MEKKRMTVFLLMAYGLTAVMCVFMALGFGQGKDLTAFANAQMTYPACGVILGHLLYGEKDKKLPRAGFIVFLLTAFLMAAVSILSVLLPQTMVDVNGSSVSNWNLYSQYVLLGGSLIAYILFWACGREARENAGLSRKNIRWSILFILLFLILYVARIYASAAASQLLLDPGTDVIGEVNRTLLSPGVWASSLIILINFPLTIIAFLGEEYGWRYYFQPILQKKFGLRAGVLLLGLFWAIWHVGIDFMYYTRTTGVQMLITQCFTCLSLAAFFGLVYMKTRNIWVIALMHFLNNNLIAVFAGGDPNILQNQTITWGQIPVVAIQSLVFFIFILAPAYSKRPSGQTETA